MGIFQEYSGNLSNDFQVAQGMQNVIKQQQMTHEAMLGAVEKFNTARDEMKQLQAQTGAVLAAHGVDENGKPDDTAPKYVHDLYNAVNKEGGIANMSRSQMIAGLKAYETGTSVEAQRLQIDAQRIKVDEMKAAIAERNAIREAQRRAEEGIKALGTTKEVTTTEKYFEKNNGEKVKIDKETQAKLEPIWKEISEAKTPEESRKAKAKAWEILNGLTSEGADRVDIPNVAGQYDDSAENYEGSNNVKNPNFKRKINPFSSPDTVEEKDTEALKAGQDTLGAINPFISREVANWKSAEDNKAAIQLHKDITKGLEDLTPEQRDKYNQEMIRKQLVKDGKGVSTKSGPKLRVTEEYNRNVGKLSIDLSKINREIEDAKSTTTIQRDGKPVQKTQSRLKLDRESIPELLARKNKIVFDMENIKKKYDKDIQNPKNQILTPEEQTGVDINKKLSEQGLPTVTNFKPYQAGEFEVTPAGGYIQKEREVTTTVQKSMIEQTQDEFNLVTNHLKQIRGYVPDNWNLQTYAMSKGIVMPQVTDLGNGHSYVQVGGTAQIVQNAVQSTGMSLRDGKLLAEAQRLGQASNMNLSVNGFNFSGAINVNDVDMANKVKDGIFKNTRAISSVNQLLDIAENASLWDKITPSEVKGIAMAIQNQIQAAGRTEIGGSGAWSEQDQARIDKIVQDPTALFNVVFAKQCIASLKGYRDRITTALNDQGTVYGFKVQSAANQQQNTQQARVAYWTAKSMGKSDEEALQGAREVLGSNFQ